MTYRSSFAEGVPPLVTVIIPVHNRADTITRAMRSVLNQTYSRLELILVDDASTDSTVDKIKAIKDDRVRLLRQTVNKGAAAARNRGLREARGEYIAFLDSDDEWIPEKLDLQVGTFVASPPAVGLVYGGAYLKAPNRRIRYLQPRFRGEIVHKLLVRNVIVGSTSGAMVRREVVKRVGPFDETFRARQDIDYWLRVAQVALVEYVNKPLVTIHTDSSGRISTNSEALTQGRLRFLEKHQSILLETGLLASYYLHTGFLHQKHTMNLVQARRYYSLAVRHKGNIPLVGLLWISSYLPRRVQQILLSKLS